MTSLNPPGAGVNTTATWDSLSARVLTTRNAGHREVTYTYAAAAASPDTLFGLPSSLSGEIPTQTFYWDSVGALDSMRVGAGGNLTEYTNESDGRVKTITDPEDHTTTYYYATSGFKNLDSVTVVDRTTKFGYDSYGRRTTVTAPNGDVTTTAYDLINRVDSLTAPGGRVTNYTYDDLYLTQIKDAELQTYDYTVNALGWVTEREDPRSESDTYAYDILGRVTTWTDRLGRDFDYEYDALGNLELLVADGDSVTYNIDHGGDYYVVDNGVSRDSVQIDDLGRVTTHWTVRGSDTIKLVSAYHDAGPRDSLAMVAPWSRKIEYNLDATFNQLSSIEDLNGDVTTFTYNSDRQATRITFPTGTREHEYPSTHKTAGVTWLQTALNDAFGFELHQDAMKRIDERHWVGVDTTRFYYYDNASRLQRYEDWVFDSSECDDDEDRGHDCVDGNMAFADSAHYSWDKVGNRTDHGSSPSAGNRITGLHGYTLTWNDAGFLTQKSKTGFTQDFFWNARGQLDSVSTDSVMTRFKYDGLGRRTQKDADGTITNYIHDGDDLLMELDSSFEIVAEYTHFPGTDKLHSMIRDSAVYYFATDEKGTVLGLYDTLGVVQNTYRYDPWGNPESESENVTNPFRYIGRVWDDETGLLYVRARYYDPEIGRFISEDPIGLAGGINTFAYTSGDPVNRVDRTGLADCIYDGVATYEWDPFKEDWNLVHVRITRKTCVDDVSGGGGGTLQEASQESQGSCPTFAVFRPVPHPINRNGGEYGMRRSGFHRGLDFLSPIGTPVAAFADGRVSKSDYHPTSGFHLELIHADGWDQSLSSPSRAITSRTGNEREGWDGNWGVRQLRLLAERGSGGAPPRLQALRRKLCRSR